MGDKPRLLVIFDLDNVIISGQSQLVLLKYLFLHGYAGIVPLLKISGWYLLYRLRIFRHPEKSVATRFPSSRAAESPRSKRSSTSFSGNRSGTGFSPG